MTLVKLDTRRLQDWDTFHEVFAETFGFPNFYGRNMNAWIDCMTSLDDPSAGMSTIHVSKGSVVVLQLEDVQDFAQRCPEQYEALIDCAAFVNWRRIQTGELAVLALSYFKSG
ncbi:MAG: barstar family protein [Armatimonadota bacterium]